MKKKYSTYIFYLIIVLYLYILQTFTIMASMIAFSEEYNENTFPILFDHEVLSFEINGTKFNVGNSMSFTHPNKGLDVKIENLTNDTLQNINNWFYINGEKFTRKYCDIIGELYYQFIIKKSFIEISNYDCSQYIENVLNQINIDENFNIDLNQMIDFLTSKTIELYDEFYQSTNDDVKEYMNIKKIDIDLILNNINKSFDKFIKEPYVSNQFDKFRFDKMFQLFGMPFQIQTFGGFDYTLIRNVYGKTYLNEINGIKFLPKNSFYNNIIEKTIPNNGFLILCESGVFDPSCDFKIYSTNKNDEIYSILTKNNNDNVIQYIEKNTIDENNNEFTIMSVNNVKIAIIHLNSNGIKMNNMIEFIKKLEFCDFIVGDSNITNGKIKKMNKKINDDELKSENKVEYWNIVKDNLLNKYGININVKTSRSTITKQRVANNIFFNNQVNKGGIPISEDDGMIVIEFNKN